MDKLARREMAESVAGGVMHVKEADPEVQRRLDEFQEEYSAEFDRRYEEHKAKEREAEKDLHDFQITY